MVDLSVIIISYNTAHITCQCIESVINSLEQDSKVAPKQGSKVALEQGNMATWEIIVVDNASRDNSIKRIKNYQLRVKNLKIIENKENVGFAKANNQGVKEAVGKYILFLNSDVIINKIDFKDLINYFERNIKTGALTVKVNLKENGIDPASHRGFPTLWRSFCYFSGLERLFGGKEGFKKIFGGYHLLSNDLRTIHEIDSPSGAFFMIRKNLFARINGFDEAFFMYGEDLDLAYRIKKLGFKIIYYPRWLVTHLKYQSGLDKNPETKKIIIKHFYDAMKIFYKKHYQEKYSWLLNQFVFRIIDFKQKLS